MSLIMCPPRAPDELRMSTVLAVGFGVVSVTRDGERVWCGDDEHRWLRRYERMAAADPDHEWVVNFLSPMQERTYRRCGEKTWRLVSTGMGFA